MRMIVLFAGALIAGAFVLGTAAGGASAFPQHLVEAADEAQAVTTVGWRRRYWRRYGEWPAAPRAAFEDDTIVTGDDDIVIIAPMRPRSCGQYHYWDGLACVDARYNDPYIGPK